MENLDCGMDSPLKFDLKGSSSNRRATKNTYDGIAQFPKNNVYKDIDFSSAVIELEMDRSDLAKLLSSIELDTQVLESSMLMDYSLLLLIEERKFVRGSVSMRNRYFYCGRYVVCMGIIDYLQAYNTKKKIENKYKKFNLGLGETISSIPPKPYKKRFIEMIRNIFLLV